MEKLLKIIRLESSSEEFDAHLALLKEISEITFRETFAESNAQEDLEKYCAASFAVPVLKKEAQNSGSQFFLAFIANEIAGYMKTNLPPAHTENGFPDSLEVQRIYIARKFKGRHIGSALIEKAEEAARMASLSKIWLGVWEHNDAAIGFYVSKGFAKIGQHNFVLGTDRQTDLIMEKVLLG